MSPAVASFLAGAIGLVVFCPLNLVVLRLPGSMAPVLRQTLLALAIHVLITLLAACLVPEIPYWHGAALFWLGFNCLLYGFSAVYKSISLRTLSTLAHSPTGSLPLRVIVEDHIRPCFTKRAALLVEAGLAQERAGLFALTAKGQILAARLTRVQWLFSIQCSGLYTSTH